ncbi:MAG TPA: hypothetical protein VJC21_01880 [Candidatus Nanoarchaeia archaeon]|nr:hypothetical protein [Candidatus Nanoarchaeia archaeon]
MEQNHYTQRQQHRAILLVVVCTLFTSLGQLFWKAGVQRIDLSMLLTVLNLPFLLGTIAYGVGTLLMLFAFRQGELSLLSPIFATSYVWVSLVSPLFYPADSMNGWKWLGVLIILIAVAILSRGASSRVQEGAAHG